MALQIISKTQFKVCPQVLSISLQLWENFTASLLCPCYSELDGLPCIKVEAMCLILSLGPYFICNEGDYRKFRLIELVSFQILKQSVGESRRVFFSILAVKRLTKMFRRLHPLSVFFSVEKCTKNGFGRWWFWSLDQKLSLLGHPL